MCLNYCYDCSWLQTLSGTFLLFVASSLQIWLKTLLGKLYPCKGNVPCLHFKFLSVPKANARHHMTPVTTNAAVLTVSSEEKRGQWLSLSFGKECAPHEISWCSVIYCACTQYYDKPTCATANLERSVLSSREARCDDSEEEQGASCAACRRRHLSNERCP